MTTHDDDSPAVDVPSREDDTGESLASQDKKRPRLKMWQESLLLIGVDVVVALVVKTFFLQPFYIPSESMEPGLIVNDKIVVEKPSYWFDGQPERGDMVVFEDPGGWLGSADLTDSGNPLTDALTAIGLAPAGDNLVKRVVGVGGDTVECCDKQGRIKVNGQALDEPYARPGTRDNGGDCYGPMTGSCRWSAGPIPDGYVFVMGDNRARSADSTVHMCTDDETDCGDSPYVPTDNVVGRVLALAWPMGRAHWTHRPDTFEDVPHGG